MHPSTVNGTEMAAQECRDALFLRYGLEPPGLPKFCNIFNAAYYICHSLQYKKVRLVMVRHNEPCEKIADLYGKAYILTHVRDNPLIFASCDMQKTKAQPTGTTHPPSKKSIGHGTEGQPSDP